MTADKYPKIKSVAALPGKMLRLDFGKDGIRQVNVSAFCQGRWERLGDPAVLATVRLGEYGGSVQWPDLGLEVGGDSLWRLSEQQAGQAWPAEEFAAWMKRMGLSLATAAKELGVTRRTVIYYKTGSRLIPRVVMLACRGLERERDNPRAA
jgi:lambda repressor-like predicted transcriptional regulator